MSLPPHAIGRDASAVTVAVAVTMVVASSMNAVIAVLAPFLQRDLGLSVFQIGLLSAGVHVVASPMSTPAGHLADRLGGSRAAMVMVGLAATGFLVLSQAPTYIAMFAAVALAGGATALSNPTTNRIIVSAFPSGRQGWAVGWKQAGVPLAALLAGSLAPSAAAAWGWRTTVAGIAAAALAAGLLALLVLRARAAAGPSAATWRERPAGGRRPVLRWLNVLGFLMGFSTGCINTYTVLYIVDTVGYSARTAGFVAALAGLSGVVLRVGWPVIAERRSGPRASLQVMAPVGVAAILVMAAAPYVAAWLVWVGGVLSGSIMVFNSLGMLAVLRDVPRSAVGAVTGALSRAFFGGLFMGPLVFGAIVDIGAYRWAWAFTAVIALAAVGVTRAPGFLIAQPQSRGAAPQGAPGGR